MTFTFVLGIVGMDKKFVMEIIWFMGFYNWEGEKSG